jgi:hypothetical protein
MPVLQSAVKRIFLAEFFRDCLTASSINTPITADSRAGKSTGTKNFFTELG